MQRSKSLSLVRLNCQSRQRLARSRLYRLRRSPYKNITKWRMLVISNGTFSNTPKKNGLSELKGVAE